MPSLDPDLARRLANRYLPNLRFADLERFYPIRAESWLGHATSGPWAHDPDDVGGLPVDPHLRGTALFETDDQLTNLRASKIAGPPNTKDTPLRVIRDGHDDSIGNPRYASRKDLDLFLSFAGWADPDAPAAGGDLEYLYDAFSEMASALDHRLAWHPLGNRPNRPWNAHPQPVSPAAYCEIDWAGVHPRLRTGDFAPGAERWLDGYVQLTYYYLFAARAPLADPPQPGVRPLEGQWAAVSLFIPAVVSADLDQDGRPRSVEIADGQRPEWIAFSLDPHDERPSSTIVPFDSALLELHEDDSRGPLPAVYVGAGSHRLFPSATHEVPRSTPPPWPTVSFAPGSDFEGLSIIVFPLLLLWLIDELFGDAGLYTLAALAALALFFATAIFFLALLALLALILLWLLWNWISEAWDEDFQESNVPPNDTTPLSPGASAGDPAYGDPAPGPSPAGPGPGGTQPNDSSGAWPTNAGSPDGWDAAYFDLMVISQFSDHHAKDPALVPPPWWDFVGRWGIKIPDRADAAWDSGTRRIDQNGRSWAYHHAHALLTHRISEADIPASP